MTGKEKSAVCNAVARGIGRLPDATLTGDDARNAREEIVLAVGKELEQLLGAGFGPETMLVRVDVARMTS